MMKKLLFFSGAIMAAAGLVFVLSCNKATLDTNTTTASDFSMCQSEFLRFLPMFNSIVAKKSMVRGIERVSGAPHYPKVTYDTTTSYPWPRTITVNYGPGVTDSLDGQFRSGIVKASFSNYWSDVKSTCSITFSGYMVNGHGYAGALTFYHSSNSATQYVADISGVCNVTGFPPILYNANGLLYTWVNGIYPPDTVAWHGVYTITGNGSGQDRNQTKYDFTTNSPLIKHVNCANMEQGMVTITPAGLATRIVTYQGGTNCNNTASVTIDGQQYSITVSN